MKLLVLLFILKLYARININIFNIFNLNFYFHTSLWYLKRFYEAFIKPFEVPQRSMKIIMFNLIFFHLFIFIERRGTVKVNVNTLTLRRVNSISVKRQSFENEWVLTDCNRNRNGY